MPCCCAPRAAKYSPRVRALALEHELVAALNACEAAERVRGRAGERRGGKKLGGSFCAQQCHNTLTGMNLASCPYPG